MEAPDDVSAAIAPLRVWHDETFTYMDFGDRIDQIDVPVVFKMTDQVDQRVNFRFGGARGQILIVEEVAPVLVLKSGRRYVCVYNDWRADAPRTAVLTPTGSGARDRAPVVSTEAGRR